MRTASAMIVAVMLGIGMSQVRDAKERQAEPRDPWSEPAQGLQCWLEADKAVWKVDEVPAFLLHVRDQGKRDLEMHMSQGACKLQFDGAWFDWQAPVSIPGGTWPAGRKYDDFDLRVTLEAPWGRGAKPIAVKPGKHKVRVAYVTLDFKQPVRVESNAVEIEVGARKPQPEAATTFECRWTDKPIRITGKGTDPAWKNAQAIDRFYLPWLGDKARPALTKTRAKLLWDREHLYFFADMEDHDLYATAKEHNGQLWNNDVFELFFKPADDRPAYYEFQVNAAGAILDCFFPRRNAGGFDRFKNDTKFHVEAKVDLRGTLNDWTDKDDGWSVEGKIPWTDFRKTGGGPEPGARWKFALCRYDYSVDFEGPELSTCAPLTKQSFHQFEDYATLRFVGPE